MTTFKCFEKKSLCHVHDTAKQNVFAMTITKRICNVLVERLVKTFLKHFKVCSNDISHKFQLNVCLVRFVTQNAFKTKSKRFDLVLVKFCMKMS